jgi:hypothetical protein
VDFQYEVVRLWQRRLLTGGLGLLPLAPLGRTPGDVPVEVALPSVLKRMEDRLRREATPEDTAHLLSAAFLLTGLRVSRDIARPLFRGLNIMRESDTYLAILEEGGVDQAQKMLLRQGRIRFGPPDEVVTTAIRGVTDLERLDRMGERLITASSWREVLETH